MTAIKETTVYQILKQLKNIIVLAKFRASWMKKCQNRELIPMTLFPIECVEAGRESYGELNIITFNHNSMLKIGNYVSIAQNTVFLLDAEHHLNHISTYPFKEKLLNRKIPEAFSKGDIVIGDDVWIGYGTVILSGVTIGQGAVIAAGAVVNSNIPPYAIAAGVPAKVIKYRFENSLIKQFIKIDYSSIDRKLIEKHISSLYENITENNGMKIASWMPKKMESDLPKI